MSVLYEKGSAEWDIGIVLTRHGDGRTRTQSGDYLPCARRSELVNSASLPGVTAQERLHRALAMKCTCGAGDSSAEQSSLR